MYLSSPVFVAINPFRLSFSRVHSRLWHTRTSANGLQSVPEDWICIISLFRGNSDSQAPFDSPQNAARFKQESSTGFLSNVLATFLFRGDNLRRVFGWTSQLRLPQLMEIWAWQLPGDKLETYCHSSLIQFFFCTVSDYCHSRQFQVKSKANKSPPNVTECLCSDSRVALLHPAVSVKSAGWIPSFRLNKPNWSSEPISVPRWLGQSLGLFGAQKKGWKSTCPTEYFLLLPVLLIRSGGAHVHWARRPHWIHIITPDLLLFDWEAQASIEALP